MQDTYSAAITQAIEVYWIYNKAMGIISSIHSPFDKIKTSFYKLLLETLQCLFKGKVDHVSSTYNLPARDLG